jgi:23S rRNA (guanine2445-N2)-methyltransferase / 23S rRNA (guanine2069-N7)-methyltransferase
MENKAGSVIAWFATCPKGMESLLASELSQLGAASTRETVSGVHFEGPLAIAYRACLWSRLANRILWPLAAVPIEGPEGLYAAVRGVNWPDIFDGRCSFVVDFSGQDRHIRNTRFGAQRSKDAIVDGFLAAGAARPGVDRREADLRVNVRLANSAVDIAVDLSGGSLHRRGYRRSTGSAPLKENLAAAILLRADWPGIAARGGALIDPMCGGATLLLEGAMMAADIAPGLRRHRYGFEALRIHNASQWLAILADASGRAERGKSMELPEIRGYDADPRVVRRAHENIERLGLERVVRVSVKSLAELKKPTHRPMASGLLVCNPPYGERLGKRESLEYLYRQLGEKMIGEFPGWQAAIFTSDLDLGKAVGLRSHKRYALWNGAIASNLLLFDLGRNRLSQNKPGGVRAENIGEEGKLSMGAEMFANRIRKNRRRLSAWLRREHIECYRLYDADMPEYAVAVDIYGDQVHVAEYRAPSGVAEEAAAQRLEEIRAALPRVLEIPQEHIVFKQRRRQRGRGQYEKQADRGQLVSVTEGRARLLVNLYDYLDTGLFLDHRPLRLRLAREAQGKRFLNLFSYTGSATVHAALGGARSTTSVDNSNTYLDWLRSNLAHNGLDETRNILVKADCLTWLLQQSATYDLVLLDPPSFSNSKGVAASFDVQRDHEALVRATMAVLCADGQLYFSNNRRGFKLAPGLLQDYFCEDITPQTIDVDFQRNRRIHCCWSIRQR